VLGRARSAYRKGDDAFAYTRLAPTVRRHIKYQADAHPEWAESIGSLPGCERIFSCIQCGTCSGACPVSIYMDLSPRRVMALVREGFREEALASQTVWLCASCYGCSASCPQKINVADVMYALKREALSRGIFPKRMPVPVLAQEFCKMVGRNGRSSEFWLVLRLVLRTNPLALFQMAGVARDLMRAGRLPIRREAIHRRWELPSGTRTGEAR